MKEKKLGEFIGSILANLIGIAFINSVLVWRHLTNGVVLASWVDVLWASNLSLLVQVTGNVILAIHRPARIYSTIQATHAAVGLLSLIVFYTVFPLDFSQIVGQWLNTLARAVLIVAMAGSAIAVVVNLTRAVSGTQYTPARTK